MVKKIFMSFFVWIFFLFIASSNYVTSGLISPANQETSTGIFGTVIDEEGMALPGITVTLTSRITGKTFMTMTTESGKYRFRNLTPGRYDIRAEMPGFATFVREDISVSFGSSAEISVCIDLTGGIPPQPTPPPSPPPQPTRTVSPPKIYKMTILENFGLTLINEKKVEVNEKKAKEDKIAFYYSKKKIFAKQGIAKVGLIEKKLNNITEIPFRDKNYIRNGLSVENNCVYAIRIGEKENRRIILIRVCEILDNKIKIECYIE